jgi:farnesyl-diphosphate farnesyltransferase
MAVLTLRRIHASPGFSTGSQVKISRRAVGATMRVTGLCVRRDWALRALFEVCTRSLPVPPPQEHVLSV